MKEVYIVAAKRTPIGGLLGNLSSLSAVELGAISIQAAYGKIGIPPHEISSVYMGNVLSANIGQSPARQAAIFGGVDERTDCTTVNKVCAAGLKATILGAQQIQLGIDDLVVTGGMESMSNVPHYAMLRSLTKLGNELMVDGLLKDGLTDAYLNVHMGNTVESCVRAYGLSRAMQDEYALYSYERAMKATKEGKFKHEIVPISIKGKNGETVFSEDEDIYKVIPEKVSKLKPVFDENGTVTAANASNINDGAAALVLVSEEALARYGLSPLAKIIGYADAAQTPEKYATSPSVAIPKALKMANLSIGDIDFWEINEAYAAVALANKQILGIDINKLNVYGGAVAMGHPLGASGARILCTLSSVLVQESGKYGVAAICNGGGGATAMVIENLTF